VRTVEEFWQAYVYLRRPSELGSDLNLYCFRGGCLPMWEEYKTGGCWILKVRRTPGKPSAAGHLWQNLLMAALGERLGGYMVVGVQLAVRPRHEMLAVWTRGDDEDPTARFTVSGRLREALHLQESSTVEWKAHQRSLADKSGFRNADQFVVVDRDRAYAAAQAAQAAAAAVAAAAAFGGSPSYIPGSAATPSIPAPSLGPTTFSPSKKA
jgi:Eukaryotic initiation factor 4E